MLQTLHIAAILAWLFCVEQVLIAASWLQKEYSLMGWWWVPVQKCAGWLSIKNIASWRFWCSRHILSLCKSVRNFLWCPRGWVNASFEPQPPKNAGKAGWHGNVWIYFWVKWKAFWPPGPLQFLAFSTSIWPAAGWALREWVNGQVM